MDEEIRKKVLREELNCFGIIIEDFLWQVRSGRVGAGAEFIPGSVNLHELSGINTQAGGC